MEGEAAGGLSRVQRACIATQASCGRRAQVGAVGVEEPWRSAGGGAAGVRLVVSAASSTRAMQQCAVCSAACCWGRGWESARAGGRTGGRAWSWSGASKHNQAGAVQRRVELGAASC